jgi:hypothetical protein
MVSCLPLERNLVCILFVSIDIYHPAGEGKAMFSLFRLEINYAGFFLLAYVFLARS